MSANLASIWSSLIEHSPGFLPVWLTLPCLGAGSRVVSGPDLLRTQLLRTLVEGAHLDLSRSLGHGGMQLKYGDLSRLQGGGLDLSTTSGVHLRSTLYFVLYFSVLY